MENLDNYPIILTATPQNSITRQTLHFNPFQMKNSHHPTEGTIDRRLVSVTRESATRQTLYFNPFQLENSRHLTTETIDQHPIFVTHENLTRQTLHFSPFQMENSSHPARETIDRRSVFATHENTPRLNDYTRKLKHIYVGTFFVMYVSLVGFIQVRFHDDNPFKTHVFFIIMSLVALAIAITTSGILFYTNDPFENTNITSIRYVILNFAFFFSTILAVLSLVMILFVPPKLIWIGYAIICALFVFMVAYNICSYKRSFKKKDVFNYVDREMV